MKLAILFVMILTPFVTWSDETVVCLADKTYQRGSGHLKTESEFKFTLIRDGHNSEITNLSGHLFVGYETEAALNTKNAYMGFFNIGSLKANPHYRPIKYKGFIQFKDVDATHTTGIEEGMWGNLVLDISSPKKLSAKYIFQAGDHMGGTTDFICKTSFNN